MVLSGRSLNVLNDGVSTIPYYPRNAVGERLGYSTALQQPSLTPSLATVTMRNLTNSGAGPLGIDIVPVVGALGSAQLTLVDSAGKPCEALEIVFTSDAEIADYAFDLTSVSFVAGLPPA